MNSELSERTGTCLSPNGQIYPSHVYQRFDLASCSGSSDRPQSISPVDPNEAPALALTSAEFLR